MEFRILGQLEVRDGERRFPLGGSKQRVLLALLLLEANRLISTDELVERLWRGEPPATAETLIRIHISKLRRLVGTERLATRPRAYEFRIEPEELDRERFERLVAAGRDAAEAADFRGGTALVNEALGLWRGDPLPELADDPLGRAEAARLVEVKSTALRLRIDCDLALGRHEPLMAELKALVAEHPYDEGLLHQLMLVLYRCGRQADALAVYRRARTALSRELGLEPGERLRDLERSILRHDQALDPPPSRVRTPDAPRGPRRVRRRAGPAAITAACAIAVGAALGVTGGGTGASQELRPNSIGVLDPHTNHLIGQVRVGRNPIGISGDRSAVWVANAGDQTLSRVDSRRLSVSRTIGLGITPTGIRILRGSAWVSSAGFERKIVAVTPSGDVFATQMPATRGRTFALTTSRGKIWVADGDSALYEVRPTLGAIGRRRFDIENGFGVPGGAVVAYHQGVWVTDPHENVVSHLNPATGQVHAIALPPEQSEVGGAGPLAAGEGSIWVVVPATHTLWRIDPDTDSVARAISDDHGPTAIAVGAGAIWLANSDRTITRIDPRTARTVATIRTGRNVTALAVAANKVWMAAP